MAVDLSFDGMMSYLASKAQANLEEDGYLAPALFMLTKDKSLRVIGAEDARIFLDQSFAARAREMLHAEGCTSYFILCDTFVSRGSEQEKTDALLLQGRDIDGRAAAQIFPYRMKDGVAKAITGWEYISAESGAGAIADLFQP